MKESDLKKVLTQKNMSKCDLIWLGEVHGIRENYDVYKILIPYFIKNGFKNIFWEMPDDFSEKSKHTEDGRVNPFSVEFFKWVKDQIKKKKIDKLVFFGNLKVKESSPGTSNLYELNMAKELLKLLPANTKTVIITGNYHMIDLMSKGEGKKSAFNFLEEKSNFSILRIFLEYSIGTFYNFGLKELMPKRPYSGDVPKFGTITGSGKRFHFQ